MCTSSWHLYETISIWDHSRLVSDQYQRLFPDWLCESILPVNHMCACCVIMCQPQVCGMHDCSMTEKQREGWRGGLLDASNSCFFLLNYCLSLKLLNLTCSMVFNQRYVGMYWHVYACDANLLRLELSACLTYFSYLDTMNEWSSFNEAGLA